VRRWRDLVELHVNDLGGPEACSEAQMSLCRRIATTSVEIERLEARMSEGDDTVDLRDSIDHASRAHDDVANSACGALVQVIADRRPALVKKQDVLTGAFGLPLPTYSKYVVAVLAVGEKDGMAGIVYRATMFSGPELLILDFDLVPLHGAIFRDIDMRARELSDLCRAHGRVTFVPESLKPHADAAGILSEAIAKELKPEALLLSAANHAGRGAVKLCEPALAKTRTSPFQGAMDFRFGEDVDSACGKLPYGRSRWRSISCNKAKY
jgi:hypothetical protein